jgi:hypothetical protein
LLKFIFNFFLICSVLPLQFNKLKASSPISGDFEIIYFHLTDIEHWEASSAEVKNFNFTRDAGQFTLDSGQVYMLKSELFDYNAAFFVGEGSFKLDFPNRVEREQYLRFFDHDTSSIQISALFMIFTDSTYSEFANKYQFDSAVVNRNIAGDIRYCIKYLHNNGDAEIEFPVLKSFLENNNSGLFYSQIISEDLDPLFFLIDPYDFEGVKFYKGIPDAFDYKKDLINQFMLNGSKNSTEDVNPEDIIDIEQYVIDAKIENNLDFSAHANISFKLLQPDSKWVDFYLYHELEIDSIYWGDGTDVEYYRFDEGSNLWVELPDSSSTNMSLDVYYRGDLLSNNDYGWIFLRSPNFWFPRYGDRRKSRFKMTFTHSDNYQLVSVGENISTEEIDDYIVSVWDSKYEIRNCSFNIGMFEEETFEIEGLPDINIYMSEGGHTELAHYLAMQGIASGGDMIEVVGGDVVNSFNFFRTKFGDPELKSVSVTEIPYSHGEAFPGLIHLSWMTYQLADDQAEQQIFRAHEVAHQWWGIGVDFETYHDQWLSEGFSQYSGMCYAQVVLQDNDVFFETLEAYRDAIINNRNYLFSTGQEGGPIWLGYRTNSSETKGDYNLMIYKKAAWVLHMLRNMMLDLKTMDESRFNRLIREFYQTYKGKKASTYDFKKLTEKYMHKNMDWFFEQWIYGTDIPVYKFSYESKKAGDGSYLIQCKVIQENVPENFQMDVPVLIVLPDDRFARFRVNVKGRTTVFSLPPLPMEPDEIIFNDLQSVLCEVEYVSE